MGEERDEGENNKAEVGVAGEIRVIEPLAEGVVAGAGGGLGERKGERRVGRWGCEEGEGGAIGVGERGKRWGEERGEEVDAGSGFGDGFPP